MIVGLNTFNDSRLDNVFKLYLRIGAVSSSIYTPSLYRASKIIEWYWKRRSGKLLAAMSCCTRRSLRLCLSVSLRLHCMSTLPNPSPANARVTLRTMRIIICERTPVACSFLTKWRLRTSGKTGDGRLFPHEDQKGDIQGKKKDSIPPSCTLTD